VLYDALSHSYNVRTLEYALPAVIGFFSGILINKLSPRYLLLFGCIGYPLKVAACLCLEFTLERGYVVFAGITLAICQGVSGSVLPYMMLTYPAERFKGRSIGLFLGLWSLCASVGAIVSSYTVAVCLGPVSDSADRYHSRTHKNR
jgi:MFS family permease